MGYFIDNTRTLAVYDSPKTGSTTLRIWLHYLMTGQLADTVRANAYYHGTPCMLEHLLVNGYSLDTYQAPPDKAEVWQLTRCPFERFGSLVLDKVIKEGHRWHSPTNQFVTDLTEGTQLRFEEGCTIALEFLTDDCRRFEGDIMTSYVHYHFCPQVNHVGSPAHPALQGRCVTAIDTKEIAQLKARLEVLYGRSLPSIHARNSHFGAIPMPPPAREWPSSVRAAVLDFYAEDFAMLEAVRRKHPTPAT